MRTILGCGVHPPRVINHGPAGVSWVVVHADCLGDTGIQPADSPATARRKATEYLQARRWEVYKRWPGVLTDTAIMDRYYADLEGGVA